MKLLFSLLLLSSIAFAGPREEADEILAEYSSLTDVTKRLDVFSRKFLGLPYGFNGPLGEGPHGRYDQDPLYRFDTFDCTTFIETITSLAISRSLSEFEDNQDRIRYEYGEVDYLKRNHFTDLQWIPFNIQNGLLSEINDQIVPRGKIKVAEAVIDMPGWLQAHKLNQIVVPYASEDERINLLEELKGEAVLFSEKVARVSYIEVDFILDNPGVLKKIPNGSIVNFVRPNWDLTREAGTHQNISHQSFLFWKGKVLFIRHASTSNGGKVQELPFIDYLGQFRNHPTLKGIHLMKVNLTSL